MKDLLPVIQQWQKEGKKMVLARVIQTWGSSPRPVGSCMLISAAQDMAGSVSGGCVEGAVLREAQSVFETGISKRLDFGVTDDEAWAVGLSCGGKIQVFLELWQQEWGDGVMEKSASDTGCVLITELTEGKKTTTLLSAESSPHVPAGIRSRAQEAYAQRAHVVVKEDTTDYFIQVFPPRSTVIIIGAVHITADLIRLAHDFDFTTVVIDPRRTFAMHTTFPVKPDRLLEAYPTEVLGEMKLDPYTYAVILSHDPKIDDDALQILLRSEVAYIGALGSRKNHEKRIARLKEKGFTDEEIGRINAPVGVDIHAQGAKEIALSIIGAIIRAKNQFT
jgi:xanthine dehydrogenase accessory factor